MLSENECTIDLSAQILKIISILDLSDSIQLVLGSFPAIIRLSISYQLEINFTYCKCSLIMKEVLTS